MDDDASTTAQLPATITTFLDAQVARDETRALPLLTEDAVIVDVADGGEVFSGPDGLRRFLVEAGTEFTYTTELTGVTRDGDIWVVGHHLEGDFPGGEADLDYRFTLAGDRIARLDVVLPS
ncbi:nuclear transport factor 2 family protein [Actinomycetospora soli]|uniref:nuclear transport factor 2 family protein n=1 Tax=Actinomycetospora soli TaxID=2893887 RepID=UPI001E348116|nr:nuclear transport factor 2 family protein [Actinomycetospora soli]MCD2187346.1 nuclear transport factor 2 family protein [Actinomycetospora soli]